MALSEIERAQIGQQIQEEHVDRLKEKGVYEITVEYSGSLGGIENCLHHPDHNQAMSLVLDRISTARSYGISEETIQAVLEISLETHEKSLNRGLYQGTSFTSEDFH